MYIFFGFFFDFLFFVLFFVFVVFSLVVVRVAHVIDPSIYPHLLPL
jgi:uncharacterized membrane protein